MTDRNPLTGLPGNRTIRKRLSEDVLGSSSEAAYVDIVNFKPFNDHYGFALGDAVIRRLGLILRESVEDFVGHIGGDDFVCIGKGGTFRPSVENARQKFRSIVPGFYSKRDREQGGIETFDRQGSYRFFPLLDVTIVFVNGEEPEGVDGLAAEAVRRKKLLKGEALVEPVHGALSAVIDGILETADAKAVIESCGVLREEAAVPALEKILAGRYSWNLRKSAALALGCIGDDRCSTILSSSLCDSNPHVRTRSVEGLALAMGRDAGHVIAPLAEDPSTWVRRAVFKGIGQCGWKQGAPILSRAVKAFAPGRSINTVQERRAALEGMGLLGEPEFAPLLKDLCRDRDYYPADSAFEALCAVGTDLAAGEILRRGSGIPAVVNLFDVCSKNLESLEILALSGLDGSGRSAINALRFFEGFPSKLTPRSVAALKRQLGTASGEVFRRLVILLDNLEVAADGSCVARVSSRIETGNDPGEQGLCAFLRWISRRGGVSPGLLLKSFVRNGKRPVAAAAASAVGTLVSRGVDADAKPVKNKTKPSQRKATHDRERP